MLNGLTFFKTPKENIFECREREYIKLVNAVLEYFELIGCEIDKDGISYGKTDPTNHSLTLKMPFKNKEGEKQENIIIPEKDKNLAFLLNGNRWIPIFQVCDYPIFVKNTEKEHSINLYNSFGFIKIHQHIHSGTCFSIGSDYWPIFLMFVNHERSYDKVLKHFKIDYETVIQDIKPEEPHLLIAKNTYLVFKSEHELLTPFIEEDPHLKNFNEKIQEFEDVEETYTKLLYFWKRDSKLDYIMAGYGVPDICVPSNGIFDCPKSMIDLLYYYYDEKPNLENRDINDIGNRRVRLAEWMLSKLAGQLKQLYNPKSDKKTVHDQSILDVIYVDSRRMNDECPNPLSELSLMTRLTYTGDGGVNKDACGIHVRNMHESYYGVIDPIDTPSGDSIGLSQHVCPTVTIKTSKLVSDDGVFEIREDNPNICGGHCE